MEIRSELIDRVQAGGASHGLPLMRRGWSLEATLPDAGEIARLARVLEQGTEIYLSALPRISLDRQIAAARAIRKAGLEPVPHLAARNFVSEEEMQALLVETGARKCLVIAGDLNAPRGPFPDALSVLRSAAFRASAVQEVAIGGYPEGHPFVGEDEAALQLKTKIAAITENGRTASLVSQFCFDAERILHWLSWLRTIDPHIAVGIGLAGPTQAAKLLKIALRCWVDLPMRSVRAAPQLLRGVSAETIVAALDGGLKAQHESGPLHLHFYSFGGLEKTAHWAKGLTMAQEPAREGEAG